MIDIVRWRERLLASGHAYYCYCTTEEIKAKREAAEKAGGAWMYDRTCLALTGDQIAANERAGKSRAVRIKVPDRTVRFDDLVHGPIEFDASAIEDFVILRSDGHPTYHLSVVADDVEMGMTHVVRGDDHISNTPKQIILYEALGAAVPRFAHVPLILGPDKKRLSKRHGATSVMEYANRGYLPEAMMNFLALLGLVSGRRRQGVVHQKRAGRGVRARGHQWRERGVQPGKARLVQPAVHHAASARRSRRAAEAVLRPRRPLGRAVSRRRSASGSSRCSSS